MPFPLPQLNADFWFRWLPLFLYLLALFFLIRGGRRSRRLSDLLKRHRMEAFELLIEKNGADAEVEALARRQVGEIMALCRKELGE